MPVWAFDTETYLIHGSDLAPKPVCASWWDGNSAPFLTKPDDEQTAMLWSDPMNHFVGANIPYDMAVCMRWCPWLIPAMVQAVAEGRVWDVRLREQLWHLSDIGGEGYPMRPSLARLEAKYLGIDRSDQKKGPDIWRLKYGTLDGVPFSQWPDAARNYALDDAVGTWNVFAMQGGPQNAFPTETLQVQASLALHLASVWGIKVNQEHVQSQEEWLLEETTKLRQELHNCRVEVDGGQYNLIDKGNQKALHKLIEWGWRQYHQKVISGIAAEKGVTVDFARVPHDVDDLYGWLRKYEAQHWHLMPQWCWNANEWNPPAFLTACAASLKPIPRSSKGPKAGEDDINELFDTLPILKTRVEYNHLMKMLETYVKPYLGRDTLHPRFNPMVTTGRTSCNEPNIQNIPRKDSKKPKEQFRKNLHARPGTKLGTVDQSALELVTLAATIRMRYGQSEMGDMINAGMDLHSVTACGLFGRDYDEFVKVKKKPPYSDERQGSKALNFGGAGGLGAASFQVYARTEYGVDWDLDMCKQKLRAWKNRWQEIKRYLKDIGDSCGNWDGGGKTIAYNNMGRRKANCLYTQAANFPFQSLAADGMKACIWEMVLHHLLGWFWSHDGAPQWIKDRAQRFMPPTTVYGQQMEFGGSPLRHSHMVNFIHDEIVEEHPDALADEAFELQKKIMVDTMAQYTNGVQPSVEGELGIEWEH